MDPPISKGTIGPVWLDRGGQEYRILLRERSWASSRDPETDSNLPETTQHTVGPGPWVRQEAEPLMLCFSGGRHPCAGLS